MRPRDIGTRTETAVVRYLRANGWPNAERRALHGATDLGDITGTPGICWEVKGGEQAKTASDGLVRQWLAETTVETVNADAAIGVLVVQQARKPVPQWAAVLLMGDLFTATAWLDGREVAVRTVHVTPRLPVRLTLADAVTVLREGGWGEPLNQEATA